MNVLLPAFAAIVPLLAPPDLPPGAEGPVHCPPPDAAELEERKRAFLADRKLSPRVSALVGVDSLGRVLVALDLDRDDFVEEVVLFTPRERLKGPWSELVRDAELEQTAGTLRLEARDRSVALALAVNPADAPKLRRAARAYRRAIEQDRGEELARNGVDPAYGRRLSSYDHTLIETWPESFREDLVVPGTTGPTTCFNCGTTDCTVGGCYSIGCNIDCKGLIANDTCGIACNAAQSFGCCNCTNGPFFPIGSCRCIPCRRLIGPIP